MSRKYISQIINQNFVYPNNEVSEYDIEVVQNINDNSVSGSVDALTVTFASSSSISLSMNYTWNLNGAEKFVRASNRLSILSVHAMSPTQEYYKPFRTVFEVSLTDLNLTTYSQTGLTFTLIPSDLGLSAFTEGTYYFEVRFIGHISIYPICLTVPVTFTPIPTVTPTATPTPTSTPTSTPEGPTPTPTATSTPTPTPTPTEEPDPGLCTSYSIDNDTASTIEWSALACTTSEPVGGTIDAFTVQPTGCIIDGTLSYTGSPIISIIAIC
jgi:hypothetical protein